jgi:hypothetical protein
MDLVGWTIGGAGIAYGIWSDYNSKKERQRIHSFLKGLKPGVEANNTAGVLAAINDEMARLIPPKKTTSDQPPTSSP